MSDPNYEGLAKDAWLFLIPDDPYAPCPCGCGTKWRFVVRDELLHAQHEATFIEKYVQEQSTAIATKSKKQGTDSH